MSKLPAHRDFIDLVADCILVAYLDRGGTLDNQALTGYVYGIIEHEYNGDRHQLGSPLVKARKRLSLHCLIEKVRHHGEDGPGVWRLTHRGQAMAQFIKRYRSR